MKKIIIMMGLLLLTFSFAAAQKKKPIKQVQVTAQMLGNQPAGKAYSLDLTRQGTIYAVAAGVDYSRIRVRTAKGEMTMTDLLSKTGKTMKGKLRVGMTSDIRTQKLGLIRAGASGLNFSCEGLACMCTGDVDCNDLFLSGNCGPIAICGEDGCVCLRI